MRKVLTGALLATALAGCGGGASSVPALPFDRAAQDAGLRHVSGGTLAADPCVGVSSSVGPYQYNAGTVPANDALWINAVANVSGISRSAPTHLKFVNVAYSWVDSLGAAHSSAMPNMEITFDPAATAPALTFANQVWNETIPATASGNVFLDGVAVVQSAAYTPRNGTVTGKFCTDQPAVSVNWQFGAALYGARSFPADASGTPNYALAAVKPTDHFGGSDHAGVPEAFKADFVGGAGSGGGGSNYTGSYSATGHAQPPCAPWPPPTPTPTSTPIITPSPTPVPRGATPTPTPTAPAPPAQTPAPTPTPIVTPTPTAAPPTATPAPTPKASASPAPTLAPGASPTPRPTAPPGVIGGIH